MTDQGLAPATVRKAYLLLSAALASAVDNGLTPLTPCRKLKLPAFDTPEMRFLDPDEIRLLARAIIDRYRALVLTASYTGLRFGELAGVRRDRLDTLRRTIRVEESLAEVRDEFVFKGPKSEASRRTLSIPTFLVEELARHLSTFPNESGLILTAQQTIPFDEPTSGLGSGNRLSGNRSARRPPSITSATPTPPSSPPRANTPRSVRPGSDAPRSRRRSTPTAISSRDSTRRPPTGCMRRGEGRRSRLSGHGSSPLELTRYPSL